MGYREISRVTSYQALGSLPVVMIVGCLCGIREVLKVEAEGVF